VQTCRFVGSILGGRNNLSRAGVFSLSQSLDSLSQVLLLSCSGKVNEIIDLVFCEFGCHDVALGDDFMLRI
jgi:hypothetical protein